MKPIYSIRGIQDLLEVFEAKLTITPKGFTGLMNKGLKGTKTIPFSSISAMQLKQAGFFSGYLQFTLSGGTESKAGLLAATKDENTFMFRWNNETMVEIRDFIEARQRQTPRSLTASSPPAIPQIQSIADELAKLVILQEKGFLTIEEFEAAKSALIFKE
jgi:hypothetical protein